jgi:hypothetical protein
MLPSHCPRLALGFLGVLEMGCDLVEQVAQVFYAASVVWHYSSLPCMAASFQAFCGVTPTPNGVDRQKTRNKNA